MLGAGGDNDPGTDTGGKEADMAGKVGPWGSSWPGPSRCHLGQSGERGGVSSLTREAHTPCSSISRSLASPKLSARGWSYQSPRQPQCRLTHPPVPSCWKLLEPLASTSCRWEGSYQGGRAVPVQTGRAVPGPSEGAVVDADACLPSSCGRNGESQPSRVW